MGTKRGGSAEARQAPREGFVPENGWWGRGPAPAGALHRAYAGYYPDDLDKTAAGDEPDYKPRRGTLRGRFGVLRRSLAGRIVLAVSAVLLLAATAGSAFGVRYYVLHSPQFVLSTSDNVEFDGDVHLTRAQLLSVFADDLERNIFRMPLAERRAELERMPWVEHATVMRLLPNHVRVSIIERTPVAFARQGTEIGLVDARGALMEMPQQDAGDPSYSFPVLTGVEAGDPQSTRAARVAIYMAFMQALDGSPKGGGGSKVTQTISAVDLTNPEDVRATVTSGGTDVLVHFGDEDFLARYQVFADHLAGWKQQYPNLASVDMRYGAQVVLAMKPGTAPPDPDSGSTDAAAPAGPAAPADASLSAKPVAKAATPALKASIPTPKPAPVVKKAAGQPTVKAAAKPVVKPAAKADKVAAKKPDANAKMFAALAAAHQASLKKAQAGVQP